MKFNYHNNAFLSLNRFRYFLSDLQNKQCIRTYNNLEQIYSNPKVKYFLQPKDYQNKMEGYCNRCPSFQICKGGCKIVTYALKGTIFDTDPLCPFAK